MSCLFMMLKYLMHFFFLVLLGGGGALRSWYCSFKLAFFPFGFLGGALFVGYLLKSFKL